MEEGSDTEPMRSGALENRGFPKSEIVQRPTILRVLLKGDKRSVPTERTSESKENAFSFASADESESFAYREHKREKEENLFSDFRA